MKLNLFIWIILIIITIPQIAVSFPPPKPEDVGMSSTHLNRVRSVIENAIDRKDFPGAVLLIAVGLWFLLRAFTRGRSAGGE